MNTKAIVAAVLILVSIGTLTAFVTTSVPLVPQVLYTPVTTTYTTMTPYTVRFVEEVDDPHDSLDPSVGDIQSVIYERVNDSLRITINFSQPQNGPVLIFLFPSQGLFPRPTYAVRGCTLLNVISLAKEQVVMTLPDCAIAESRKVLRIDVPMRTIGNPDKIYPEVDLARQTWLGIHSELEFIDQVPDGASDTRAEVDLRRGYARTLTRTFVTSSTYSSAYTVTVPLSSKMPWLPTSPLLAGLIIAVFIIAAGAAALYLSWRSATALRPTENETVQRITQTRESLSQETTTIQEPQKEGSERRLEPWTKVSRNSRWLPWCLISHWVVSWFLDFWVM